MRGSRVNVIGNSITNAFGGVGRDPIYVNEVTELSFGFICIDRTSENHVVVLMMMSTAGVSKFQVSPDRVVRG